MDLGNCLVISLRAVAKTRTELAEVEIEQTFMCFLCFLHSYHYHNIASVPYGRKLWQWENLANSLQKVIGRIKFGEFAM